VKELIQSWYDLLNGNLSCEVYKEDAPEGLITNYVLIRAEGGIWKGNKRAFADDNIVIIDIVTMFENNINRDVCEDIDSVIQGLLFDSPSKCNLSAQSGIEIENVYRQTTSYLPEDNGIKKYYRKVSRYSHRILQTT